MQCLILKRKYRKSKRVINGGTWSTVVAQNPSVIVLLRKYR